MKIAVEIFSLVIAITLACILFASIISSNNQICNARDFYNVVINRIEDSDCNESVIQDCISEAYEKGYELSVEDLTIYEQHPSRLVVMGYSVSLPVFSLFGDSYKKEAVIEGYAR